MKWKREGGVGGNSYIFTSKPLVRSVNDFLGVIHEIFYSPTFLLKHAKNNNRSRKVIEKKSHKKNLMNACKH